MGLVGQKGKVFGQVWFGQWIVGVISFQKIFGLCCLKGHIVKIRWGVTLEDNGRRTECEDRARILKQNSQYGGSLNSQKILLGSAVIFFG